MRQKPTWGEFWWADLEHAGRRPVLVLTRPEAVGRLPRILVVPATRTVRGLPSEVHLDESDGLPSECVLNLDTPALVDPLWLTDCIGSISAHRWSEVCTALHRAVNC